MLIGQMKIQANNTWQDHSLCVDVQWGCSYAFCALHPNQLSSVSLRVFQIRSDTTRKSFYYTQHTVFRSVGQFSILFSQMCADAQQFSHRSCQTCQTATNDIKRGQLNIKGTFKTKTGKNQRIKFETSLFILHFVKTTCFATI